MLLAGAGASAPDPHSEAENLHLGQMWSHGSGMPQEGLDALAGAACHLGALLGLVLAGAACYLGALVGLVPAGAWCCWRVLLATRLPLGVPCWA